MKNELLKRILFGAYVKFVSGAVIFTMGWAVAPQARIAMNFHNSGNSLGYIERMINYPSYIVPTIILASGLLMGAWALSFFRTVERSNLNKAAVLIE